MTVEQLQKAIAAIVNEFGDTFVIDKIIYGNPIDGEPYECLAWFFVTGKESLEENTVAVTVNYEAMII